MKDLLINLTVCELIEICKKHQAEYCQNCPLLHFCDSVGQVPLEKAFEYCPGTVEL